MRINTLEPGVWWTFAPELDMKDWRLCRTPDDWLVVESPPVVDGPLDAARALAALWLEGSGQCARGTRLMLDESDQLRLQACAPVQEAQDLQGQLAHWQADLQTARQALTPNDSRQDLAADPAEDPLGELAEEAAAPVPAQQLMQALHDHLVQDPVLQPWLDFEPAQARLSLVPEEADWAVFMQPGAWPEWVELLLPLDFVPQEEEAAAAMLRQALRVNSALVLGPQASLGLSADAEQLLLQSWVDPHTSDSQALRSRLGLLVGLSQSLAQEAADAAPAGPGRMDLHAQDLWQLQSQFIRA